MYKPFTIDLDPPYGQLTATAHVDWIPGAVRYVVTGQRVSGTFTVRPYGTPEEPIPTRVIVEYGDGPQFWPDERRTSRPTVNGVEICGSVVVDPTALDEVSPWFINARKIVGPHDWVTVPKATAKRTTAIVRAVVGHWQARPDRDQLIRAAARDEAPYRLAIERGRVQELWAEFERLTESLAEHLSRAETYAELIDERKRCTAGPPRRGDTRRHLGKGPAATPSPSPPQQGQPEEAQTTARNVWTRVLARRHAPP